MKSLYLMMCVVVCAGCHVANIQGTEDDVIAQRLTLEWKRVVEDRLDTQEGEIFQLARILNRTVHYRTWLESQRDQARPEHKAIYQAIINKLVE